jgi:hypothetical protein
VSLDSLFKTEQLTVVTLYTAPTGNGFRASIMLEETGCPGVTSLAGKAIAHEFYGSDPTRALLPRLFN